MNGNMRGSSQRSSFDVTMFVIGALGFFTGVAATIVTSIPFAIFGGSILALVIAYFAIKD